MPVFGVDYAWGRPGTAALKRAGAEFACRYLSHDTTGKNLTRAEAVRLSDAGIWLVAVWETTARRPLAGRAAGADDARHADAQAKACGMPPGRPIYFAADWDATAAQQDEIHAYLDGAASVIGVERVGLYGGYWPVKRAFDAKKITYGWQTYAWSGGRWDARAHLRQYSNDHRIDGVGLDYDHAMASDYGQWRVGVAPEKGDEDMPPLRTSLSKSKAQELAWGQFTNIRWDRENADPGDAHADGDYPGYVAPDSSWADLDAVIQVRGLAPGDQYQLRFEVHDWAKGKSTGSWSECRCDALATSGDQYVTGSMPKYLRKGQHVYAAVAVFRAEGSAPDRPAPRAIGGRYTIRQERA
ncbi:glycoside hydrolase domain-containing protein [Actinomadura sp. K4S16]|uniref:glycoside hydrolase domain-containing protein n=1 Tax=Actinomadura sp. K4S16 TaxID=1316147 RepID=UPI0011EF3795|nr:glycoside hydrolase domain-containing protein [Actinomadura sp. K4S16]